MNNSSKKALMIGGFLAVIIAVSGGYYKFMFQSTEIKKIEKQIKSKETEIKQLKSEFKSLSDLEGREPQIRELLARLEEQAKRLPPEEQVPELLLNVKEMLKLTSFRFLYDQPEPRIPRDFYAEVPYVIKGTAPYHNFGQFLNLIEVNPERLMRVKKIEIKVQKESDIEKGIQSPFLHDIDLTIAAYVTRKGN